MTFFRALYFDSCGSKPFDRPSTESADWYDLVSPHTEIKPADAIKGMVETDRKANAGVRRHGRRATVLTKIASAREEGSDDPVDVGFWHPPSLTVFVTSLLKVLHCVYLTMRGKIVRISRWFRQARQPLLTACGRLAISARCC